MLQLTAGMASLTMPESQVCTRTWQPLTLVSAANNSEVVA